MERRDWHSTNLTARAGLESGGAWRPPFLPRGLMRPFMWAFDLELYRLYVLALHRRYSKSRSFLNAAGAKARDKGWPVWHTYPTFAQGRDVLWNATDAHGRRMLEDLLPYTSAVNDQRMILHFGSGGYYQVMGTDKVSKRMGGAPKCIGYDEFSLQNPMARNYNAPMLKDNGGIEVLMFTFRGENHAAGAADFAKAYPDEAFYLELNVEQTIRDAPGEERFGEPVITQADIDYERRLYRSSNGKLGMSESMVRQEFYNSREGVNQAQVYGAEMAALRARGGLKRLAHDPLKLVHTAWDRGVHNRIGFFQRDGDWIRIIDHLSTDNSSLSEIALLMREDLSKHGGPNRAKYNFGNHYVGRDAEDPVPWHKLGGLELAEGLGIKFTIVPHLLILTGIERVRGMLAHAEFDAKQCEQLVNAIREYAWAVDPATQEISGKEPDKRQLCRHDADMLRVMALAGEETRAPAARQEGRAPMVRGERGYLAR